MSSHTRSLQLAWEASWYGSDPSIVVGDIDYFLLSTDKSFLPITVQDRQNTRLSQLKIQRITHPELGSILGIINLGLEYRVYLSDGIVLHVNAEEEPGTVTNTQQQPTLWNCHVTADELAQIEAEPAFVRNMYSEESLNQKLLRYQELLNLQQAPTVV